MWDDRKRGTEVAEMETWFDVHGTHTCKQQLKNVMDLRQII